MANKTQYCVRGTAHADPSSGERFYRTDPSTGYPYSAQGRGDITSDLSKAVSWCKECVPDSPYIGMHNAKIYEVTYVEVKNAEITVAQESVDGMIAGMSAAEKSLMKKALKYA